MAFEGCLRLFHSGLRDVSDRGVGKGVEARTLGLDL